MNPKQSVSVLLMLGLLAPMAACGGTDEGAESSPSPAVTSPAASPEANDGKAKDTKEKKEEGGEGGES